MSVLSLRCVGVSSLEPLDSSSDGSGVGDRLPGIVSSAAWVSGVARVVDGVEQQQTTMHGALIEISSGG